MEYYSHSACYIFSGNYFAPLDATLVQECILMRPFPSVHTHTLSCAGGEAMLFHEITGYIYAQIHLFTL